MNGILIVGGIIDSEYRGNIKVLVRNLTTLEKRIYREEKICQLLIIPIAHFHLQHAKV